MNSPPSISVSSSCGNLTTCARRYLRFHPCPTSCQQICRPAWIPRSVHTNKDLAWLGFPLPDRPPGQPHSTALCSHTASMVSLAPRCLCVHGHKVRSRTALFEDVSGKAVFALLNVVTMASCGMPASTRICRASSMNSRIFCSLWSPTLHVFKMFLAMGSCPVPENGQHLLKDIEETTSVLVKVNTWLTYLTVSETAQIHLAPTTQAFDREVTGSPR